MRRQVKCICILLSILASNSVLAAAGEEPQRGPDPAVLLERAFQAMGGVVPDTTILRGQVTRVLGSSTEVGSVTLTASGLTETEELTVFSSGAEQIHWKRPFATRTLGDETSSPTLEEGATLRSVLFPLQLVASARELPFMQSTYRGQATADGRVLDVVRIVDSYADQSGLASLAGYSTLDLFLDTASGLPARMTFVRRHGSELGTGHQIEVDFRDFVEKDGVISPSVIEVERNGVRWLSYVVVSFEHSTVLDLSDES